FPRETTLFVGGSQIRAFPLWPPKVTGPVPFKAELAAFDRQGGGRLLAGKIALLRFNADAGAFNREHAELIAAAVQSGASAAVAIPSSPSSEIVAMNVTPGIERCAVPVVLAGARDEPLLEKAASKGLAVSLLLNGADEARAEARNVIGRLSKGEKLIVISTP